eukprot:gene17009-23292_t
MMIRAAPSSLALRKCAPALHPRKLVRSQAAVSGNPIDARSVLELPAPGISTVVKVGAAVAAAVLVGMSSLSTSITANMQGVNGVVQAAQALGASAKIAMANNTATLPVAIVVGLAAILFSVMSSAATPATISTGVATPRDTAITRDITIPKSSGVVYAKSYTDRQGRKATAAVHQLQNGDILYRF